MDPAPFQQLYNENPTAKAFFDNFARRRRNRWETTVQRTLANLQNDGNDTSRGDVIAFFRRMEELNAGQFVVGRHSHSSRFTWSVENIALARAATGEPTVIPDPEPEEDGDDDEILMEHSYNLREDFVVEFALPPDLTRSEADRLSAFVKTLPFGDD